MALEKRAPDVFEFPEVSAPGTPPSGYVYVYAKADGKMYRKDDTGTETELGGSGGGAPSNATYIVQTADATLSNEQALSSLATGLMKSTNGTGVVSTVAAPSGAVVGTSDTQTLTNKTIAYASNTMTGLIIGTDVQGYDADLAAIAAFAKTKGHLIVADGSAWQVQAVGSNNKFLMADSAASNGVSWQYPSVATYGVYKAGALYDTTSTSFSDVDATNVIVSASLRANVPTLVGFFFGATKLVNGSAYFRITDGTNNSSEVELGFNSQSYYATQVIWAYTPSADGSYSFKLQFRSSNANTARVNNILAIQFFIFGG